MQVVYHGASTSNLDRMHSNSNTLTHHHSTAARHHHGHGHHPPKPPSSTAGSSTTVLSAKKSAEIAAVFSGARINQTTDVCGSGGGGRDSDEDSTDAAYDYKKSCRCGGAAATLSREQFSRSNMHTSLGYFP